MTSTETPPLRARIQSALAEADAPARRAALARLAARPLGMIETIQLDKALAACASGGEAPLRLALLSTHTVDHLLPGLRVAALRHGLHLDAQAGGYGQYRQELLDPASALHRQRPDFVLLSLAAAPFIAGVALAATADEAAHHLDAAVRDLAQLWSRARESIGATPIQQTFLDPNEPLFGSHDRLVPGSPASLIAQLNERIAQAAARDGVLLLDLARASARDGLDAWYDVTRWLHGKMEIAPQAAPNYGELCARLLAAQRGRSRKCLVLDLDNTLWGGVVGDVGIAGLVLGEGSARGEAHLALQRYARQLRERGVILAVCSKNEQAFAESVFREHPEMLLKRDDIAAFVANWGDKAENLRAIAERLNIGLDSLVFVDDNPAERARVREALPMVAVPELPDDPALYVRAVARGGWFESVSYTRDDAQRAAQYAMNAQRDALRESAASMDDYLHGLQMVLQAGPIGAVELERATQLINKTNQFNTTTRRLSADEVRRMAGDSGHLALQFRLADRFGDNGLVSVMILGPSADEPEALDIDTWVMSCRVFGRQLEHEAMNLAVEQARRLGARALTASYIPSERNGVVRDLFAQLGFAPVAIAPEAAAHGTTRWRLDLAGFRPHPTAIRIEETRP